MIDDLWYKNAIIYSLDLETFMDGNGDGVGDFQGLMRPARLSECAGRRRAVAGAIPAIAESRQRLRHFGFLRCRSASWLERRLRRVHAQREEARHSRDHRPRGESHLGSASVVQSGAQRLEFALPRLVHLVEEAAGRTGTREWYSRACRSRYGRAMRGPAPTTIIASISSSRISTSTTEVRVEIRRIMGYWLELGVNGFRVDAVPFMLEPSPAGASAQLRFRVSHRDAAFPAMALRRRGLTRRGKCVAARERESTSAMTAMAFT